MFKRVLAATFAVLGLLALGGQAAAAPSSTNAGALNICNRSTSAAIGAIHTPDGNYAAPGGNYDRKLEAGRCSRSTFGWPHTGGFYVANNYRVNIYDIENRYLGSVPQINQTQPYALWHFHNNPNATYNLVTCWYPDDSQNCIGL